MADVDPIVAALRARRLQLGLSQAQVGACLGGTGRSWICDLEAGRHTPTLATLRLWCDAVGVELVTLTKVTWEVRS